jgi:hypothetical protein
VFEDVDSNEQRAATTTQRITKMLACLLFLKNKKSTWFRQASALDTFMSSSGTRTSPPVLPDIENYDSDDPPTVQQEVSPP